MVNSTLIWSRVTHKTIKKEIVAKLGWCWIPTGKRHNCFVQLVVGMGCLPSPNRLGESKENRSEDFALHTVAHSMHFKDSVDVIWLKILRFCVKPQAFTQIPHEDNTVLKSRRTYAKCLHIMRQGGRDCIQSVHASYKSIIRIVNLERKLLAQ